MKEPKSHKSSKKHKKEKHSKKHKKHKKRERSSSTSSDSSSGSDGGPARGSALSQLERERAAVQAARYLLASQPAVRKSFRELLWELDNGRAVGLAGVPDALLRSQLQHTLGLLGLKLTKGQYWLPSGAPSTLSIIGPVFDEPPRPAAAPPAGMPATPAAAAAAGAPDARQPASAATAAAAAAAAGAAEEQQPRSGIQQQQQQQQQDEEAQEELHEAAATAVGPVGPPVGPHAPAAAASSKDEHQQEQQHQQQEQQEEPDAADVPQAAAPKRRVMGPAAPPAELLAAAAAYHADVEAAGGYQQDAEPLVGPPPPDFVDEADAAPAGAREAQVLRVLRVLREAAAAAANGPAAAGTGTAAGAPAMDPYAVLGVEATADAASIRKSYWRVSLLVHPDKCSHPAAQEAFQAVSKAAQLLQDTQQRAAHDAAQADAALRQQAVAAAAAAEREVAWRKARGEAVPAELAAVLAAAQAAQPAARDTWMTDLPTQQDRSAASVLAAGLSQVSQTSFNRFGSKKPGDSSGWTDTPQQAAQRAAGLLPAAGPAVYALAGPSASAAAIEGAPVSAELLAAMAKYNASHRQKSLLEQHAEQAPPGRKKDKGSKERDKEKEKEKEKEEKREKKEKSRDKDKSSRKEKEQGSKGQKRKAADEPEAESWQGKHPWQPWDRDKDLEVQLTRPKAAGDLLKAAGNLSSRFSSGGR